MRQFIRNLLPAHGVVANGTAIIEIEVPEPMKVHRINLIYTSDNAGTVERRTRAVMLTEVKKVSAYINNKPQRQLTTSQIFTDLERRNETIDDGIIPIAFSRDERELSIERDATAFFAGIGDKLRLNVELGAATTPFIDVELEVEPFNSNGQPGSVAQVLQARGGRRQLIETVRTDTVNVTKTGQLNINLMGEGRDLSALLLRTSDCDFIEIYRGVDKKWEGTPADYDRHLRRGGYATEAGVIVFSPEMFSGGRVSDWYQYRGKQLIAKLNMTAANSFGIDIHEVGDAVR